MLALSLIIAGILLRFAPHAPNFTPVAAIAVFSGAYLSKKQALFVPLVLMVSSDIFLGFHNVVPFTWGGFILITFLGFWMKKHKNIAGIVSASLVSSLLFYIVSNFGVWLMGWYPHTSKGLADCYIMALPFLRDFTLATVSYLAVFVGIYELVASGVKNTKFAKVLLSN
ncbi:MAG: DUF6580 family putative transport protein [Deltaproteobacteria bacterium]